MGSGALSLVAINRVGPERRGNAMGTFTAAFDLGMLVGSPVVGAAAALAGYGAAFYTAAIAALVSALLSASFIGGAFREREPLPGTLEA